MDKKYMKLIVRSDEIDILVEAVKEYRENYKFDEDINRVCTLLVDRILENLCSKCKNKLCKSNHKMVYECSEFVE